MNQPSIIGGPSDPDRILAQVRANVAFENMVVAVLTGAAASGVLLFAVNNAFSIAKGSWTFGTFASIAMGSLYFVFLAFLAGFLTAVVVAMPLFLGLEKLKVRKIWPYAAAAAGVGFVALWIVGGQIPFERPAELVLLLPGILMAVLFGLRMRPIWRAVERAESQPAIYRVQ